MTRLIASDLDGTFLQTGGTVSPENVAAIARAHAKAWLWSAMAHC